MATMDIFNQDAFSLMSMTGAVQKMPYKPGMLGAMNLFTPESVTTETVAVERIAGELRLIQTSQRGAPPTTQNKIRPDIRDFRTVRLMKQDTIRATEIQGVRAFGTENETETLQRLLAQRQQRLRDDLELTFEYHRLGAVQGIVLDADGSTIRNYFTEFGISQPSEIAFTNAAVTSDNGMRAFLAKNIVRPMLRAAQVGDAMGVEVVCLCGDNFYDWLVDHADVKATFLNWSASSDLRQGVAFQEFRFGGVVFINYRGTDDNSTVAIGTAKAKFFLRGVPGLFTSVFSPGESFELANTLGQSMYSRIVPEPKRNEYVELEVMSYPLLMCKRPETLLRGTYS